jgi:hypothetical protein
VRVVVAVALLGVMVGCSEEETLPLVIAWKFPSGDCTSNEVSQVRVTVTPDAGDKKTSEFACSAGRGDMGVFPAGSYGIGVDGLDPTGRVVAQNFGTSTTFSERGPFADLDVTLQPKAANVVVSWSMSNGSKCPGQVVLPYFIAIYKKPASGTTLTDKVKETQESCSSGTATLESIPPGNYVVELDSRAVTPKVRGTKDVTVKPGVDAAVAIQF